MRENLPIWDDLSDFKRASILTLMFFLTPAITASGFSDNMILRFFQTIGLTGVLAFGFLIRHNLERDNGG